MAANKPFVSKEMKGLSQQIKKLAGEQKALRKQLREHAQKVIDSKFDDKLLDALEELEKKEVEMETQHIALRRSWLDATQKERRERLQESQSKLSKSGGLASSRSIFSNSVAPRQLDELSTRVFGKSSRAALKGPNPFLEEQYVTRHHFPITISSLELRLIFEHFWPNSHSDNKQLAQSWTTTSRLGSSGAKKSPSERTSSVRARSVPSRKASFAANLWPSRLCTLSRYDLHLSPSLKLTSSFATAHLSMTQMRSTQFWMISEMSALL